MHTFADNAGRTWTVTINVAAVKRVRALLKLDLYTLLDDGFKPLAALVADPVRLADVLFCLCKDEAEKTGVTDEDFCRALAGDAITIATEAFVSELTSFFPDARIRAALKKLLEKGKTVRDRLLDHAALLAEQIDPEAEAKRLIASFGSSPASCASIPARSPSPSS